MGRHGPGGGQSPPAQSALADTLQHPGAPFDLVAAREMRNYRLLRIYQLPVLDQAVEAGALQDTAHDGPQSGERRRILDPGSQQRVDDAHRKPAFRYGEQEFVVLLPGCDEAGALEAAGRIQRAVRQSSLDEQEPTTVSVGIAVYPQHGDTPEELIKKADQTLFQAEHEGREQALVWHRQISRFALRADRLTGIITGDQAKDVRNVSMLLDTIVVVVREVMSTTGPRSSGSFSAIARRIVFSAKSAM